MTKARIVFSIFSVLFQPLYFLMLWMYVDELQQEEDELARLLDIGILILGVVFLIMQAVMLRFVWTPERARALRTLFRTGLVVWFFLEVVLSYWWCFVTGADPIADHTPFVLIFLGFNAAQFWALRRLGVLDGAVEG
jgi:hypothetical protein